MKQRIGWAVLLGLGLAMLVSPTAYAAAPPNDSFAAAAPVSEMAMSPQIGGSNGPSTNVGATGEAGEPNHAGASLRSGCMDATHPDPGCESSVWYRWTVPTNQSTPTPYTIDLCQSSDDTTLGVYTAHPNTPPGANNLDYVASNDETPVACSNPHASKVSFDALPQTTYYIAVAGYHATTVNAIKGDLKTCAASGDCAPAVTTGTPTLSNSTLTLKGTVNPNGLATTYHFQYGPTTDYGTNIPVPDGPISAGTMDVAVQNDIPYSAGTTYHYRIVASSAKGMSVGADQSFPTTPPPTATTQAATPSSITAHGATLNGTVNQQGQLATYHFEYGQPPTYPPGTQTMEMNASPANQPDSIDHAESATISGLNPGTTYQFRIVAKNPTTMQSSAGNTLTFTTLAAPAVTTGPVSAITYTDSGVNATLNGSVNWEGDATDATKNTNQFDWGPTSKPACKDANGQTYPFSTPTTPPGPTDSTDHQESATLTRLTKGATYYYRIEASNTRGTTCGAEKSFVAAACITCVDFNADGKADILWHNPNNGQVGVWTMSGTHVTGWQLVNRTASDPAWVPVTTGDFNGDGKPDILWRNTNTGEVGVWTMDGTNVTGWQLVDRTISNPAWRIAGTGDFNADGKPDILFRNINTGEVGVWTMDATHVTGWQLLDRTVSDPAWRIAATADFNGDNKPDILFHNVNTGEVGVWTMNGTSVVGWQLVDRTVSNTAWRIAAADDFNGDLKTDILFRNTDNGQVGFWTMDGTHVTGWQVVDRSASAPTWVIVV